MMSQRTFRDEIFDFSISQDVLLQAWIGQSYGRFSANHNTVDSERPLVAITRGGANLSGSLQHSAPVYRPWKRIRDSTRPEVAEWRIESENNSPLRRRLTRRADILNLTRGDRPEIAQSLAGMLQLPVIRPTSH